jgi:D-tyrosyl-tRNA(Tyr) deacylase
MLILLAVAQGDDEDDARWLAEKCRGLRIFNDPEGKMNLGLDTVGGSALVISQFTLLGDCKKGRRPSFSRASFSRAADPKEAERLYEFFATTLEQREVPVKRGIFGAMMKVTLINDGPVTLIVDSSGWKRRRTQSPQEGGTV